MRIIVLAISFFLFSGASYGQANKKMLSTLCSTQFITDHFKSPDKWHPFLKGNETARWAKLVPEELRKKYIAEGEKLLKNKWDLIPVTMFLEFTRTGNRSDYEKILFDRRKQVSALVLAEVMEGKGRFIDDIINGVWAICEETFWGIPPHLNTCCVPVTDEQRMGFTSADTRDNFGCCFPSDYEFTQGFPDFKNQFIDLFASETGCLLAWTYYLVGNELDKVSPSVSKRMVFEVNRRILEPCLKYTYNWMNFTNNWNAWVNSNWLTCILIMENDPGKRIAAIQKSMKSVDHFIDSYPSDGGCVEGPSYWSKAGGSLFTLLNLLYSVSDGKANIYNDQKIVDIGLYISKLHICGKYFVNFGDGSAVVTPDPGLLFNIGSHTSNKEMLGFASYFAKETGYGTSIINTSFGSLFDILTSFIVSDSLKNIVSSAPLYADSWLPDTKVCTARTKSGSCDGFFFATLAGSNAQPHNHLDKGSFVLYYNGQPLFIDAGVGTYTANTFNEHRYEIWTMQSAYHNLPTINGQMERPGRQSEVNVIRYTADPKQVVVSLDISKAYPQEAEIKMWNRTYTFNRKSGLKIKEDYELNKFIAPLYLSFMTFPEPVIKKKGEIEIQVDNQTIKLIYPASIFQASVEKVDYTDRRLSTTWGRDYLYRIVLKALKNDTKGSYNINLMKYL